MAKSTLYLGIQTFNVRRLGNFWTAFYSFKFTKTTGLNLNGIIKTYLVSLGNRDYFVRVLYQYFEGV